MKKLTYKTTIAACYNGYVTQAISVNLAPLLYLTFQRDFDISVGEIATLIAANFIAQLAIDLAASGLASKLPIRPVVVVGHLCSVLGLCGLAFFPNVMDPLAGLMAAEILMGIGGGVIEVLISPLVEACPTDEKSGNMSLLHSFYSWGQAGVALLSTLFFKAVGIETHWRILPCLWAIVPLLGAIAFLFVPVFRLKADTEAEPAKKGKRSPAVRKKLVFFILLMLCAGASELVMSQWASAFMESALGVDKATGDLLGPCLFALLMGVSRVLYGKRASRLDLTNVMIGCSVLMIAAYLMVALGGENLKFLSLVGCGLCGLSVGICWPGILSEASAKMPDVGMEIFAMLALAGDVGCLTGPSIAGWVSDFCGGNLHAGFLFALIYPVGMLLLLLSVKLKKEENKKA